jgi:hypothetical protein
MVPYCSQTGICKAQEAGQQRRPCECCLCCVGSFNPTMSLQLASDAAVQHAATAGLLLEAPSESAEGE